MSRRIPIGSASTGRSRTRCLIEYREDPGERDASPPSTTTMWCRLVASIHGGRQDGRAFGALSRPSGTLVRTHKSTAYPPRVGAKPGLFIYAQQLDGPFRRKLRL